MDRLISSHDETFPAGDAPGLAHGSNLAYRVVYTQPTVEGPIAVADHQELIGTAPVVSYLTISW